MKLRALERDPFSPLVDLQISMSHFYQRRYDDTIEWARKALEIDPRHPHAREFLAGAYLKKGDSDRYMEENLRHAELHGAPAELIETLRSAYSKGGAAGVVRFALGPGGEAAARLPRLPDGPSCTPRWTTWRRRSSTSTVRSTAVIRRSCTWPSALSGTACAGTQTRFYGAPRAHGPARRGFPVPTTQGSRLDEERRVAGLTRQIGVERKR